VAVRGFTFQLTNVDTDRRELAKTIIRDFMLVQGNDWFIAPFSHKVGSLATLDQLLVRTYSAIGHSSSAPIEVP
jgi:hypothetical protein